MKVAKLEGLNTTEVRAGVQRGVFSGDGATLAFTTLDPGHTARPHSHSYEQIVYVMEGELLFVVGDEEVVMRSGDMLVVPPGVEHWAQTLGDEPAVDLSVFTPRRDEYAAEESPDRAAPEVRRHQP
jgi:quercetin dioxygenase-like cupin family protein